MTDTMPVTSGEMVAELLRVSKLLDDANADLKRTGRDWAHRENEYRRAKASAFVMAKGRLVGGKPPSDATVHALVDQSCESERLAAHLAEAEKVAALQLVRSLQTQLSAIQTVANAVRAEIGLAGRYDG